MPEVLDSSGRALSWRDFLDCEYDTKRATFDDATPRLQVLEDGSGGVAGIIGGRQTNADGVAEFILRFVEAPPDSVCALRFVADSGAGSSSQKATRSLPTLPFELCNNVLSADLVVANPTSRVGLGAVGAPRDLSAFAKGGLSDESFPVDLALGDVVIGANISRLVPGETVGQRLQASLRLGQIRFRAFRDSDAGDYDEVRERHLARTRQTVLGQLMASAVNRSLARLQDRVEVAGSSAASFRGHVAGGVNWTRTGVESTLGKHPFGHLFDRVRGKGTANGTIGEAADARMPPEQRQLPSKGELLRLALAISPMELMDMLAHRAAYR